MKILFVIALLWFSYQLRKFLSNVKVSNNKNARNAYKISKERMDIQDADYEDVE